MQLCATVAQVSPDSFEPVNGLVDARRAAAILGIPQSTFRAWASRSQHATGGIPAAMPKPVATMNGKVYRAEDIHNFGRQLAQLSRPVRTIQRDRGAYFTPSEAARMMVRWCLRSNAQSVLEPSLGEGQFARAIKDYAQDRGWDRVTIHACELDPETADTAIRSEAIAPENLHIGDFNAQYNLSLVDAVIGNPPYVRIRDLDGSLRENALEAAHKAMGQAMENSGSAWMPFVAKSATHLKTGGRMAFVLPLDFTYVRYARPLWKFLGENFGQLNVTRFQERVFPNILQNVLILFASDKGSHTDTVTFAAFSSLAEVPNNYWTEPTGRPLQLSKIIDGEREFQKALLPRHTIHVLDELSQHTMRADEKVKFNIGYVSGNKKFFHPSAAIAEEFDLPASSLFPTVSSSRQLSGQDIGTSTMGPTERVWVPQGALSSGERRYIEFGESTGVDMAYKCRIRRPWYVIPGLRTPDVLMTTFSDVPRIYLNDGHWFASNSTLCGYARPGVTAEEFIGNWYTPFTLLSLELQIHSLGGGVMIAVPREADSVEILPARPSVPDITHRLNAALKSNDPLAPYDVGSEVVRKLVGEEGLSSVREAAELLMRWRKSAS